MFIIAAIVVIAVLGGLKANLSLQKIVENQRHLVAGLDSLEFNNIRSEMIRVLQISFNSSSNMTENLNRFNSFVTDALATKNIEFHSLLVETYVPILVASQNTIVNITVYNSLGTDIKFLNLTLNGTSNTFTLQDKNSLRTSFTVNIDSTVNDTLTIFYNTSSTSQTETATIPFTIGSSKYVTFFDIRYISSRGQQSDKFVNTLTLY